MLFSHITILNKRINIMYDEYYEYNEYDSDCGIVCALLPQISNVKISMVTVTNTISEENIYTEYIQMIEEASRENLESSICLMLFSNAFGEDIGSEMAIIAKLKFGNNERFSFCGGVMKHLETNNETIDLRRRYCAALLIIGSIQTWSIVLEYWLTGELVKEKLKLFKGQVKLQKHSVGFVFTSENHQPCNLYVRENQYIKDVLSIYKELFPEVPLVGCFNHKEFVRDTTIYKRVFLSPRATYDWMYENSITFMILTYG